MIARTSQQPTRLLFSPVELWDAFLTEEDFEAIALATGERVTFTDQPQWNWRKRLNSDLSYFIAVWREFSVASDGEIAKWACGMAAHARATLLALGCAGAPDLALGEDVLPALAVLQQWGKSTQAERWSRRVLPPNGFPQWRRPHGMEHPPRLEFAVEIRRRQADGDKFRVPFDELTTESLGTFEVFERAIAGVAMIACLAEAAADKACRDKKNGTRSRWSREAKSASHLFVACNETYERATGRKPGGTRRGQTVGGPCVRFYVELLARAKLRMPTEIAQLHPDLMKALDMTDAAILTRIQRAEVKRKQNAETICKRLAR